MRPGHSLLCGMLLPSCFQLQLHRAAAGVAPGALCVGQAACRALPRGIGRLERRAHSQVPVTSPRLGARGRTRTYNVTDLAEPFEIIRTDPHAREGKVTLMAFESVGRCDGGLNPLTVGVEVAGPAI